MAVLRRSKTRPARAVQQEPLQLIATDGEANTKSNRTDREALLLKYKSKAVTRKAAIRAHCVECMGGYVGEVAYCTSPDCALYPYRMGSNPFDQRTIKAKEKGDEE